jgi:hypothetical protein
VGARYVGWSEALIMAKEFSPEELNKLLEDLSYAISQPAADHFRRLTQEGKGGPARKLLRDEGFSIEEAQAIYKYYAEKQQGRSIVWREVTADEVIALCGTGKSVNVLVRYRSDIFMYPVSLHTNSWSDKHAYEVLHDHEFKDIREMDQLWIGDPKEVNNG